MQPGTLSGFCVSKLCCKAPIFLNKTPARCSVVLSHMVINVGTVVYFESLSCCCTKCALLLKTEIHFEFSGPFAEDLQPS